MTNEIKYAKDALESLSPWLFLLPTAVQRNVHLALSLIASHGSATPEELQREIGPNWVIARRTSAIVKRYGEDVIAISPKQYQQAELRAIESRF